MGQNYIRQKHCEDLLPALDVKNYPDNDTILQGLDQQCRHWRTDFLGGLKTFLGHYEQLSAMRSELQRSNFITLYLATQTHNHKMQFAL